MLISLHMFIDIMGNNAPSVHSNSNDVSELLFFPGFSSIRLGLASCKNISVELSTELIQTIDLHAFCEDS
jgi:hypothetical protein